MLLIFSHSKHIFNISFAIRLKTNKNLLGNIYLYLKTVIKRFFVKRTLMPSCQCHCHIKRQSLQKTTKKEELLPVKGIWKPSGNFIPSTSQFLHDKNPSISSLKKTNLFHWIVALNAACCLNLERITKVRCIFWPKEIFFIPKAKRTQEIVRNKFLKLCFWKEIHICYTIWILIIFYMLKHVKSSILRFIRCHYHVVIFWIAFPEVDQAHNKFLMLGI